MANANIATGLTPIMDNGMTFDGQGQLVCFAASYAQNVFLGDPLVYIGGGDANGVPYVQLATAGATNVVAGSFGGISNGPAGQAGNALTTVTRDMPIYHPASTLQYGLLFNDPNQLFAIQEDSVGGAIAAGTGPAANGNLVAGAGNVITGRSGWQLQSSSVSATANATYQLRILGILRGPDNGIGVNAKWIVRMNLPQLWGTAGV